MTERTTPITVHLTDEQMDHVGDLATMMALADAVKAQRPRPITVGDRVRWNREPKVYNVEGAKDGEAWLWDDEGCIGTFSLTSLTRVDDAVQS